MKFELSDLRVFIAVIEQGGITQAAKKMHRVPSAVTSRIQRLEEILGIELFMREKKRLWITSKGRDFYDYAKKIIDLAAEAERYVKREEPGGRIHIGAMESVAASRLAKPLSELYASYAALEVELSTGVSEVLYKELFANRLDVILVADAPENNQLERVCVFEEELVLIASKKHKSIQKLKGLDACTVLAFKEGCSYRNRLLNWLDHHHLKPARIAQMGSYHAILGGVAAGMGVGIVPKKVLELFPKEMLLSVYPIEEPFGIAHTELIWRKEMVSKNILALQACLKEG